MARRDWDRLKREESFSGAKCAMSIRQADTRLFRSVLAGKMGDRTTGKLQPGLFAKSINNWHETGHCQG